MFYICVLPRRRSKTIKARYIISTLTTSFSYLKTSEHLVCKGCVFTRNCSFARSLSISGWRIRLSFYVFLAKYVGKMYLVFLQVSVLLWEISKN